MGYSGGRVSSLCNPRPLETALHAIASAGGDALLDRVERNTPEDSGDLRRSWYREPPVGARRRVLGASARYQVWVRTDNEYAAHVEHGTGLWGPKAAKYPITPKTGTWLSWIDPTGVRVYARRVMHPGSRGSHMMARAANTLEHEIPAIAAPRMRDWVRAQESWAD